MVEDCCNSLVVYSTICWLIGWGGSISCVGCHTLIVENCRRRMDYRGKRVGRPKVTVYLFLASYSSKSSVFQTCIHPCLRWKTNQLTTRYRQKHRRKRLLEWTTIMDLIRRMAMIISTAIRHNHNDQMSFISRLHKYTIKTIFAMNEADSWAHEKNPQTFFKIQNHSLPD